MPPLAGDRIGADEEAPGRDDPAADAGSEDDAEHDLTARRRTIGRLGEGKAIRVVGKAYRPAERRLEITLQRGGRSARWSLRS